MGDIDYRAAGTPLVRRAAGTVLTALAAGALITGCAPAPGGGGSNPAPDDGGGSAADSGPDQSGSSSGGGSSAEKVVVKTDMGNKPGEVKPDTFALGTTGGDEVDGIKWSSWGSKQAVGKGTVNVNTCEPSCAGGGQKAYKNATIKLTVPKTYSGQKQYTRYTITAPGMKPEQLNEFRFQPTNPTVQRAEKKNEVSVDTGARTTQRPVEFTAGGVGHMRTEGIVWSSWNGSTAVGKGTLKLDRCEPSCAGGGVDSYRNATVKLTGVQQKDGEKQYTKYTMTAPGLPPETARMLTNQQIEY